MHSAMFLIKYLIGARKCLKVISPKPKLCKTMLEKLNAPKGTLVIMDRGITTEANIGWLIAHHYRCMVVSRERARSFDADQAVKISTASNHSLKIHKVVNEDDSEAQLYCYSEQRKAKEQAVTKRFADRFKAGLQKISDSLAKPGSEIKF